MLASTGKTNLDSALRLDRFTQLVLMIHVLSSLLEHLNVSESLLICVHEC